MHKFCNSNLEDAFRADQQVSRFQIPVKDVVGVEELQTLQRHGNDGLGVARGEDDGFGLDDVLDVGFEELVDERNLRFASHNVLQVQHVFVLQFLKYFNLIDETFYTLNFFWKLLRL